MRDNPFSFNLIHAFLIIGGLALAVVIGVLIGSGDWATLFVPVLAMLGGAAILLLGNKYWLLIPFSLSFTLPIIPIGTRAVELPELIIFVCTGLFVVRSALKAQKLHRSPPREFALPQPVRIATLGACPRDSSAAQFPRHR